MRFDGESYALRSIPAFADGTHSSEISGSEKCLDGCWGIRVLGFVTIYSGAKGRAIAHMRGVHLQQRMGLRASWVGKASANEREEA